MTATARSAQLRASAQRVADALPASVEEVVVTGSVSRGVAGEGSDIEMLVVTAGAVAGAAAPLPGRARRGADRGGGADMGRVRAGGSAHAHTAGRTAGARRTAGRRRVTRGADRVRAEPRLAADPKAARGSGRDAHPQARATGGADRGGADGARPSPR